MRFIIRILIVFCLPVYTCIAQVSYSKLDKGLNSSVREIFADTTDGSIYAGGNFWKSGDLSYSLNHISKWNGTKWDSLGSGMDGNVLAITRYKGLIYAGGAFLHAGGIDANGLALWDGNQWNALFSNEVVVSSFIINNDELYIMGSFDTIAGIKSSKIAKYNGATWTSFPTLDSVGGGWVIASAIFYKGELYVGGNFVGTCGPNMNDIARFDGASWKSVGNGLSGSNSAVNTFAIYNDELYVGGYFSKSDGDPGDNIAKWDGAQWSEVGGGLHPSNVYALKVYNGELYAGGQIDDAGGLPINRMGIWDGAQWRDGGINFKLTGGACCGTPNAFDILNNELYIGGGFKYVNDTDTVNNIVKYTNTVGVNDVSASLDMTIRVYPNPSDGKFQVESFKSKVEKVEVYNLLGEIVFQTTIPDASGQQLTTIDLSNQPNGIYFLNCKTDKGEQRIKVVKQ